MQLVEQHIILKNNKYFKEIDEISFASKNLYNACLYKVRQEYINNKNNILFDLYHLMKDSKEYKVLPAKVSAYIILTVLNNFKSFFKSNREWIKNPSKFNGRPHLPKYLDPINGRYWVSYTNQAISKKVFKKINKIKLSSTNVEFNTKIKNFCDINCVRLIPKNNYYVIEVVYTIKEKGLLEDNKRYIGIDIGVNNLAMITSNIKELKPYGINGKPLKSMNQFFIIKSMNQFYNKKLSKTNSILEIRNKKKTSKNLNKLNLKRKNKIDNYLHKASKYIINNCINDNINTIIIGKNENWKQDINIGKKNNQNFVQIPHSRFIDMIKYKCEIVGINVITKEESYTSKCSFLDLENIKKQESYKGKRIKRGLFKSLNGSLINADVNGSYNILRKVIPNVFSNGIDGVGVHPKDIKSLK